MAAYSLEVVITLGDDKPFLKGQFIGIKRTCYDRNDYLLQSDKHIERFYERI